MRDSKTCFCGYGNIFIEWKKLMQERVYNFWSIPWKGKGYCEKEGWKVRGESYEKRQKYGYRSRYVVVNSLIIDSIFSIKSVKYEEGMGYLCLFNLFVFCFEIGGIK